MFYMGCWVTERKGESPDARGAQALGPLLGRLVTCSHHSLFEKRRENVVDGETHSCGWVCSCDADRRADFREGWSVGNIQVVVMQQREGFV